ncbi:MAG: DnaJ domain-containing protein [Minwuiales bacterium]|nr:DnaJ domain-containing protein [Minwuiales bacterium]
MPYLVLGICLLVGLVLMANWFVNANPKQIVKGLKYGGAALLALLATFFAITGRFALAAPAGVGALMLLGKWPAGALGRGFPGMGGLGGFAGMGRKPSPGQSSEVETGWIRMTLDHDSGDMDGEILKGRFEGRRLGDLSFDDLIELLSACHSEDEESGALIATYLERVYGPEWQQRAAESGAAGGSSGGGNAKMTAEEAYEILGLAADASDDDIREAHRTLMKKLHPDQGGSTYLASKINEAKDLLLNR